MGWSLCHDLRNQLGECVLIARARADVLSSADAFARAFGSPLCGVPSMKSSHSVQIVAFLLSIAGGPGKVSFTAGALGKIYHYTEGIPRRINALCDRALLIAYSKNTARVDRRLVNRAVKDIGVNYFQKTMSRWGKMWSRLTA